MQFHISCDQSVYRKGLGSHLVAVYARRRNNRSGGCRLWAPLIIAFYPIRFFVSSIRTQIFAKIGTFSPKTSTFHHANAQNGNISAHPPLISPLSDTSNSQSDTYYRPNSARLSKIAHDQNQYYATLVPHSHLHRSKNMLHSTTNTRFHPIK